MKQRSLFDDASAARDAAIDSAGVSVWLREFVDAISNTATVLTTFTTDHVLQRYPHLEKCGEKRVMGAAVRHLSQVGVIEPTGRYVASCRKESHARPKREWRRKT